METHGKYTEQCFKKNPTKIMCDHIAIRLQERGKKGLDVLCKLSYGSEFAWFL